MESLSSTASRSVRVHRRVAEALAVPSRAPRTPRSERRVAQSSCVSSVARHGRIILTSPCRRGHRRSLAPSRASPDSRKCKAVPRSCRPPGRPRYCGVVVCPSKPACCGTCRETTVASRSLVQRESGFEPVNAQHTFPPLCIHEQHAERACQNVCQSGLGAVGTRGGRTCQSRGLHGSLWPMSEHDSLRAQKTAEAHPAVCRS